jgi:hypothetical protein
MPQSHESSLNFLSNRKRIGRLTSWFLAGLTGAATIYGGFPSSTEARTISSLPPTTLIDTPCSSQTNLEGQKPEYEGQNGLFTVRGYHTGSNPLNSRFIWTYESSTIPNEGAGYDKSTWNVDMTILARPAADKYDSDKIALKTRIATLSGDDIEQTLETILPLNNSGCIRGELNFINGSPNMDIDGINVVRTDPTL